MKISTAIVDLSALLEWPHHHIAASQAHQALDPWHSMRMSMGASMAPPRFQAVKLRPGVILFVGEEGGAAI